MVIKFRRNGAEVELIGLNDASAILLDRLAIHNNPDTLNTTAGH
jgi:SulP family sulfate permease